MQVKLLRVLQEREIERVGSGTTIRVDVRVIAATHRDLRQAMRAGGFREDLFYRLNVMPIEVPPLRRRREDSPLLVTHFIERFNERTGKRVGHIDDAALGQLMDHDWPGNVRELENAIEHAFIRCRGDVLLPECLPVLQTGSPTLVGAAVLPTDSSAAQMGGAVPNAEAPAVEAAPVLRESAGNIEVDSAESAERERVLRVLWECRWNRSRAASRLGMHRTTLWRKMREWGIAESDATEQ